MGALEIFLVALGMVLLLMLWEGKLGLTIDIRRGKKNHELEDDDERKPDPPMLKP